MDMNPTDKQASDDPEELSVVISDLSERFTIYSHKADSVKEKILKGVSVGRGAKKEIWALKNISLEIPRGKVVGIIGENGSGKTTLLKLIAGILKPDKGTINVRGSIAAILQLGVGFQRDLSGRDNVYLNSAMLGIPKKVIDERIDDIIRFSELENFIDMPLKTYSSGMEMRLGFSIAANVDPDILLIDEVLIIGDEAFQRKCLRHIDWCKSVGKTIILVSHSMNLIQEICDITYLLRQGALIAGGETREVINYYYQTCGVREGIAIIKDERWEIIFNNGHVYVLYQQRPLTVDPGIFFSFESSDKTVYSFSAEWTIRAASATAFEALGYFASSDTTISFSMECLSDGSICYSAASPKGDVPLELQGHFISSYDMWYAHAHTGHLNVAHLYKSENIHEQILKPGQRCGFGYAKRSECAAPPFVCSFDETAVVSFLFTGTEPHEQVMSISSEAASGLRGTFAVSALDIHARAAADREISSISGDGLHVFIDEYKKQIALTAGGKAFSHAEGLFTSLLYDTVWMNLSQFDWRIEKKGPRAIALIADSHNVPIRQLITIAIQDGSIAVKASITSSRAEIAEVHMSLLTQEMFSRWHYEFSVGEFPEKETTARQQVSLPGTGAPFLFALEAAEEDAALLYHTPGLSSEVTLMLYAADHYGRARVISLVTRERPIELSFQLRSCDLAALHSLQWGYYCIAAVALFSELTRSGIFRTESGIFFCAGRFYFVRDNRVITPAEGLHLSCYVGSRRISSIDAVWTIEKRSEHTLVCRGTVPDASVVFAFDFEVDKDHIRPQLSVLSPDDAELRDLVLSLTVDYGYTQWRYNFDTGNYTAIGEHASEYEVPIPNSLPCQLFSLSAAYQDDALVMRDISHATEARLCLHAITREDRYLRITYTVPRLVHAEPLVFDVAFMADSSLDEQTVQLGQKRTIACGDLRMVFDPHRVRLFYKEKDILSGPGLYAVISSQAYTYDTKSFEWTYEKRSEETMKVIARHVQLTFTCEWLITLHADAVQIQAQHETSPSLAWHQTQFVFTFDEAYTDWFYNLKSGSCRATTQMTHWQELPLPNKEGLEYCGLCGESQEWPDIVFTPTAAEHAGRVYLNNAVQPFPLRALSHIFTRAGYVEAFHFMFHVAERGTIWEISTLLLIRESVLLLHELIMTSVVHEDIVLIYSAGIFRLIYQGQEITHPSGIKTLFLNQDGVWAAPEASACTCRREGDTHLIVTVGDNAYSLDVSLEDNRISFHVKDTPPHSTQCNFIIPIHDGYERWFFNYDGAEFGARTGGTLREQLFSFTPDHALLYGVLNTDSLPGLLFDKKTAEAGEIKFRTTPQAKQIEATLLLGDEKEADKAALSFLVLTCAEAPQVIDKCRMIIFLLHPVCEAIASMDAFARIFTVRVLPILEAAVLADSCARESVSGIQRVLSVALEVEECRVNLIGTVAQVLSVADQVNEFNRALYSIVLPSLESAREVEALEHALKTVILPALHNAYAAESCRTVLTDILIPAAHAREMIAVYRTFSELCVPAIEAAGMVESLRVAIIDEVLPCLMAAQTVESCAHIIEQVIVPSMRARAMIDSYQAFTHVCVPALEAAGRVEAFRIFCAGLIAYMNSLCCEGYVFIFEKGPVQIFKNGRQITKRKGLNVSFLFAEKKYDADDFLWTFERIGPRSILCRGSHDVLPIRQLWRFENAAGRMHIEYVIESDEPHVRVSDFYIECMVSDEYASWIMSDRGAPFETLHGLYTFENVPGGYLDGADVVGLMGSPYGAMIFSDFSDKKFHPSVLNWQSELACRSVKISREMISVTGKTELSFALAFVNDQQAMDIQKHERLKRQIESPHTRLYCDNKKVTIAYKEKAIMAESGISSIIRIAETEYHSLRSAWVLREKSNTHMEAEIVFPFGKQIMRFSLSEDDSVHCEIFFETDSVLEIEDLQVFILFEKGFIHESVVTHGTTRAFPEKGSINEREAGPFCLVFQRNNDPLAVGLCSDLSEHIGYEIEDEVAGGCKLLKLHKKMTTDATLKFNLYLASSAIDKHFVPYEICRNDLFFCASGKEHALFCKESKITQAMGLYTSYYHADFGWCDSIHHAQRKCTKIDEHQMQIECAWNHLGVLQEWRVKCIADAVLEWSIRVHIQRKIFFEKEQINVMLSPHYLYWRCAEGDGIFPHDFTAPVGSDWDLLFKTRTVPAAFTFSAHDETHMLPPLGVAPMPVGENWEVSVVNSDDLFSGRVLRASRTSQVQYKPGTYEYCVTRCYIEEDIK